MKIAVVGCGALGSYYGGKLHRARHQVHFLLRSDYDHVRRHGIEVISPQGDFHFKPKSAKTPEEIGPCDLVIVSLKTTANRIFGTVIPPLVTKETMVLCLQNGLGNIEDLERFVPRNQIVGGLCFICVNREAPGVIRHLDHGLITIGEAQGWPEPRTHDLATSIQQAGIPCKVTDNLLKSQWEKLVWNIPFNGLGVAASTGFDFFDTHQRTMPNQLKSPLTTEELLSHPDWAPLVRKLMLEIIRVANALGFPVEEHLADKMIENTRTMGHYRPSTVIDYEKNHPLEYTSMFARPLEKARQTRIKTPILNRLCTVIQQLTPQLNESIRFQN